MQFYYCIFKENKVKYISKVMHSFQFGGRTMRTINKINAGWAFSKEAKSVPAAYPAEWTQLDLPYTWNGKDGQDG